MMGYAETREDLNKGSEINKLFTGDLGYYDEDGFSIFQEGKKEY